MITVREAQEMLFKLVSQLPVENVSLAQASGRVLARDVSANRDQPPFAASSMDGYAVKTAEVQLHAMFKVTGEAAAGHRFDGPVGAGHAVRIFTGAPMPTGTDFVVIQEDVTRNGDLITITDEPGSKDNVRPAGVDFTSGSTVTAPRRLNPQDVALLAAMNVPMVPVTRKPVIALISTGDELVMPGDVPGPDQIIASNTFGLKAMLENLGASVRILPIARDTVTSLQAAFGLARDADLVITIGGASVGDHDLVGDVAASLGIDRAFYKVRMRPGKPLMAGRINQTAMVGLPGNPVSAMICGKLMVAPMVEKMLGLGERLPTCLTAVLAQDEDANGTREHYVRASVRDGKLTPADSQDSSLLSVLANANALWVRAPNDPPRQAGEPVQYLKQ